MNSNFHPVDKKIKTHKQLVNLVQKLRKEGKRIVTTNGCFDLLHPGHLYHLLKSKAQGDVLIVGLNSDSSIKKIKGENRPILPQGARALMLTALECVDYVTIFDETTPNALLETLKPDIHTNNIKYGKNCVEAQTVQKCGGRLYLVKNIPTLSTTNLIQQILNMHKNNGKSQTSRDNQ